ncbi:hypothetical protein V1264_020158 [Littorina saxatilis]|uniref:Uncharacterized protein n=1 Tax=Littorina saxatilis TaxID=31220 RepID=A0AAN9BAZ5_9CAEN
MGNKRRLPITGSWCASEWGFSAEASEYHYQPVQSKQSEILSQTDEEWGSNSLSYRRLKYTFTNRVTVLNRFLHGLKMILGCHVVRYMVHILQHFIPDFFHCWSTAASGSQSMSRSA